MQKKLIKSKLIIANYEVELSFKPIRRMYLRVGSEGVKISAPLGMPLSDIEKFVVEKNSFIEKNLKKRPHYLGYCRPLDYGDCVEYLGDLLYLEKGDKFSLLQNRLICPSCGNLSESVNMWVGKQSEKVLAEIFEHCRLQAGVSCDVKFRTMKSRWGSCNKQRRLIVLNRELIRVSAECIQAVCYHELAHLRFANHQQEFYKYLFELCPNYKSLIKTLKSCPLK